MSEAAVQEPPVEDPEGADAPASIGADLDTRPKCEKCGVPSESAACPSCGWYPVLNTFVEIDHAYEAIQNPDFVAPTDADATPPKSEWEKHWQVWSTLIPAWGWVIIAVSGGILATSLVARIVFELTSSSWRTTYSLTQLFLGVSVGIVVHLTAFILCSSDDAEMGVKDVLVKPFKAWSKIGSELPYRAWLVQVGSGALAAILGATLIIGGIPYERLLDWGFKERAKTNLVGAIADQASKMRAEEKSMEEAMSDFASQAGDGVLNGDAAPVPEKPRTKLDCLLIGYRLTKQGRIDSLLLATEVGGRLKYIGDVRPKFEPEEREALLERLAKAETERPFVRTSASATWLRPKFTCRASFTEWPEGSSRPRELQWEELLEEMKLPW